MEINFNGWEFDDLAKELNKLSLNAMLNKYTELGQQLNEISKDFLDLSPEGRKRRENEYNKVDKERVFVAVRIAQTATKDTGL